MSTPITLPFIPTFSEARKQSNPPPEPRSRTISPFFNKASAIGLPQPRPRLAPSGTAFRSASVYPIFLLMLSASMELFPQHGLIFEVVQEPPQQPELLSLAILP